MLHLNENCHGRKLVCVKMIRVTQQLYELLDLNEQQKRRRGISPKVTASSDEIDSIKYFPLLYFARFEVLKLTHENDTFFFLNYLIHFFCK